MRSADAHAGVGGWGTTRRGSTGRCEVGMGMGGHERMYTGV